MKVNEYLENILKSEMVDDDAIKAMEKHRDEVTTIIEAAFEESKPIIKYGGSRAKGTMNKSSYDLDVIIYFDRDDTGPGDTLKDIYNNVKNALSNSYEVYAKRSALRLKSKDKFDDFHIDVVPGRFTDETRTDVFIHQSNGDKDRLKTNLKKHVDHIKESGATQTIRLAKLWNLREGLRIKTFVLELLVVKALESKNCTDMGLENAITIFWAYLREHRDSLNVEDPANSNNDLSDIVDEVRDRLCDAAESALELVDADIWEEIFGSVPEEEEEKRVYVVRQAAAAAARFNPPKPWAQ